MRPNTPRVLTARDLHAMDVSLNGSGGVPAVPVVVAARITVDGSRIVVLGHEPPFVHVLTAAGAPLATFGSRGDGGLQAPVALAVSDAGDVLVADATGPAVVFGLDGVVRARIADTGVLPMAAAAPCAGEWLVYGPPRGAQAGHATEWLHRIDHARPAAGAAPLGLSGAAPGGPIGLGRPTGLVAAGGTAVLRHEEGGASALVTWRCGQAAPARTPVAARGANGGGAAAHGPDGTLQAQVPPGARMPSGVAMVTGGVLLADAMAGTHPSTELTLLRGGAERRTQVSGMYALRDSRPGVGILLQTNDPAPRLFVVSEKDVLSLFP